MRLMSDVNGQTTTSEFHKVV